MSKKLQEKIKVATRAIKKLTLDMDEELVGFNDTFEIDEPLAFIHFNQPSDEDVWVVGKGLPMITNLCVNLTLRGQGSITASCLSKTYDWSAHDVRDMTWKQLERMPYSLENLDAMFHKYLGRKYE